MNNLNKEKIYAVITGDIVASSNFKADQRVSLLSVLKESFKTVDQLLPRTLPSPFKMYRGDSFQGLVKNPEEALKVAIIIRSVLRSGIKVKRRENAIDARIAIGLGTIDYYSNDSILEGDGEAYRLSGPVLDSMKSDTKLIIQTPWSNINKELEVECALLDVIINKWSPEQSEAIIGQLKGFNQKEHAKQLGISNPALNYRLAKAGINALLKLLNRYQDLVNAGLSLRT